MKIEGYRLSLYEYPGVNRSLYAHQAVMLDEWQKHDAFLLVTKTGSGKTAASAMPVLLRAKLYREQPEGAVFVYPTNALIEDQERSIRKLIEAEGMITASLTPANVRMKYGNEEIVLVRIDADRLEAFARSFGFRKPDGSLDKGRALAQVLKLDKPKIVLVNPDILYLIYALAYRHSAESVALLQAYQTVVFDEFHLYGGVELAHALFLIHLARALHTFKRVVLLSATPDAQTMEWIGRLLAPFVVDPTTVTERPMVGSRLVAHDVELLPVPRGQDIVETTCAKILELRDMLLAKRVENRDEEYVPGVVILNSVVRAIELEDKLVEHGFSRTEIAPIRGLSSRAVRDIRGKILVIGTSAIEVGIDFKCDYLLFEAGDSASFMQRFGRVGRHQSGIAYLLETNRVSDALNAWPALARSELERQVYILYENADTRSWFVGTMMGMFTVFSQADTFRRRVAETRHANPDYISTITKWIDGVLDDYAKKLGIERKLIQVRKMYERLERGSKHEQWISDYAAIAAFRTSLPSEPVYDRREAERRGKYLATFNVDLYTLIRQAHAFHFNDKTGEMVVSGGWEKPHYAYFTQPFNDEDCGQIKTTKDYSDMVLLRDGHLTSASHLMVKPKPHIFIVLPKKYRDLTDWRMAVFPCGEYIVAFDGDALLLWEVWKRTGGKAN